MQRSVNSYPLPDTSRLIEPMTVFKGTGNDACRLAARRILFSDSFHANQVCHVSQGADGSCRRKSHLHRRISIYGKWDFTGFPFQTPILRLPGNL